jgi:hypothetical protein
MIRHQVRNSFSGVRSALHRSLLSALKSGNVARSGISSFPAAKRIQFFAILIGAFLLTPALQAQVKVFVDFTEDTHNGAGGAPNGIPDWVDELGKLTTATGVDTFTPVERTAIESGIMSLLTTTYSGYDITFSTTAPASPYDTIHVGPDSTGAPSPTTLGGALTDQANTDSSQSADIYTANFKSILDEFSGSTGRPMQIGQLTTALAGTGAHELGHTFGLDHQDSYSHPSIHPGTYAATGGVQNIYIMATGETGLSETERETPRTLAPWSRAKLDIAGGAAGHIAGANQKLVASPILLDVSEEGVGVDAGSTIATAKPMTFAGGSSSGMLMGFVAGNPDASTAPPMPFDMDIDMWRIGIPGPGLLSAEIFSLERFGAFGYNTKLELFDSVGTLLFGVDNLHYDDDTFNAATFRQFDPAMINIPLSSPGFYFLKVSPTVFTDVGPTDGYWLMAGFRPIPEPASLSTLCYALGLLTLPRRRSPRRRQ